MLGNSIYFKQTTLVKQNQQHIETAATELRNMKAIWQSNLAKHFQQKFHIQHWNLSETAASVQVHSTWHPWQLEYMNTHSSAPRKCSHKGRNYFHSGRRTGHFQPQLLNQNTKGQIQLTMQAISLLTKYCKSYLKIMQILHLNYANPTSLCLPWIKC